MKDKIVIGTRFWEEKPGSNSIDKLKLFIKKIRCENISERILVAVNIDKDKSGILNSKRIKTPGVNVFGVTPWGWGRRSIQPLNAIVFEAAKLRGVKFLLLVSATEITRLSKSHVTQLYLRMDEETLVAGAVMKGHDFKNGKVSGNALTVPWNTLALWNLEKLSKLGFPLISDAPFNKKYTGMEEVSTISLFQTLKPFLKAKLVEIPGIEWETDNLSEERLKRHEEKMRTKKKRANAQMKELKKLGFKFPIIDHIPIPNK